MLRRVKRRHAAAHEPMQGELVRAQRKDHVARAGQSKTWLSHFDDAEIPVARQEVRALRASGTTLVAAARYDNESTVGASPLPHLGGVEAAIVAFDALGESDVISTLTGASTELLYGVEPTTDGVVVAGGFGNNARWTGQTGPCPDAPLSTAGGGDGLVAELSATGCPVWVKTLGGSALDRFYRLDRASNGDLAVIGHSFGDIAFDGMPIQAQSRTQPGTF
jgi:hypothetical protein